MKWLARKLIANAERATGETADFMRDIHDASPAAFWKFGMFTAMARHKGPVPPEAVHAARIAAVMAEDCGPCLQTVVNYALGDKIDANVIRAAVIGDADALDTRTRTAFLFARAVAARDPICDEYRQKIELWWGKEGAVELAFAIASTRVFPTVKRAMGYAQACQHVIIEGQPTPAVAPYLPSSLPSGASAAAV